MHEMRRQAVVTAIGVLSPIGSTSAEVLRALREGRHGLSEISRFDAAPFRMNHTGEVKGFAPEACFSPEELREYDDLFLQYAIAAARQTLENADLTAAGEEPRRDIGLVLGTCNGGLLSAEDEYRWKHGLSAEAFDEAMNLRAQLHGFGKALTAALKIAGETWVVTTACSSTTMALGLAQTLINRGYYDKVLVGGADAICLANVSGFDALKATSDRPMAPFSQPFGLNVGEGACFWMVEEAGSAKTRGAATLGWLAGQAATSDAHHPTSPDPRGLGAARTLEAAWLDSGFAPDDLGCINAHGSGTEANDRAETKGIMRFLDGRNVPVVSTKSFFGHCMGATGILEATCQLLAMNEGFLPPTLNFTAPRPGCPLDYVPNQPRPTNSRAFISANYAFGGNNAAVVVSLPDLPPPPRPVGRERVVVTGAGVVSSLGLGVETFLERLRSDVVGIRPVSRYSVEGCRSRMLGEVPEFHEADVDRRLDFSDLNPLSRFAVAAGRLALAHAGLRPGPAGADRKGVVMGVANGSSEMDHLDRVFSTENHAADIPCFSNVTANSTAGWVSNQLYLKGVNATFSGGPNAGLQSLAHAFDVLAERGADLLLAGAADEVYQQTYTNYDGLGFLFHGDEERDYRSRPAEDKRMVLGEGAAILTLETAANARARDARVLAELLGYGMGMDAEGFLTPNLGPQGVDRALELALSRSGVAPDDIGLILWAPQGNRQDLKMIEACRRLWPEDRRRPPMAATSFNTGYLESASILATVAAAFEALEHGSKLWPQRTGLAELDDSVIEAPPDHILALGSSDSGYSFAVVFRRRFRP